MSNVLDDLMHPLPIVKFRGFFNCIGEMNKDPEVIEALQFLKSDTRLAVGRRMCDFSDAVLHILGVEEYNGDNEDVWLLIETRMGHIND